MIKKIILSAGLICATSLSAIDYDDKNLNTWRDGFITAFKAMQIDTKVQGIKSNLINTKKYLIYFDASGEDIATWDKLMVQMFGYTSSVHKPVRTTNNWIIFNSYDNKATAMQELKMLNDKIFKNSKIYKLQLKDISLLKTKLYNSKALLMDELQDLEDLLRKITDLKIKKEVKSLHDNQKIAIVYVDEKSGELIDKSIKQTKKEIVNDASNEQIKKEVSKVVKSVKIIDSKNKITIFSTPQNKIKNKIGVIKNDDQVFEVYSKDKFGWCKLKGRDGYISSFLIKNVSKSQKISNFNEFVDIEVEEVDSSDIPQNDLNSKAKTVVDKKVTQNDNVDINNNDDNNNTQTEVEDNKFIGKFQILDEEAVFYKLDDIFKSDVEVYSSNDFIYSSTFINDFENHKYSYIVADSDGIKYVKFLDEDVYIELDSVKLIDLKE